MNRWTVTYTTADRPDGNSVHHINETEARAAAIRYEARGWTVTGIEPMTQAKFDALVADMLTPR
jgi:hypothetical protein